MSRRTDALVSSLLLAFIVLSFDGYYEYASGQELEVFTDKQIYNLGDTVVIFGTVPALTAAPADEPVKIELFEPSNIMHPIGQPIPQDGTYELKFELLGELAKEGTWTVIATYVGQEALTSFNVVAAESEIIETGYPFTVETDKRTYVGDDVITVSGTVPVVGAGLVVGISISDPTAIVYTKEEVIPASDGTYSFSFTIETSLVIPGMYSVQAIYGDQSAQTQFELAATIEPGMISQPKITIDHVTTDNPRYGIDSVNVTGNVTNSSESYSVTVVWGDNTTDPEIPISDGKWGPVSHIYNYTAVGERQIVARLIGSIGVVASDFIAESEPVTVNVRKHSSDLTLYTISKLVDNQFTLSGRLYDIDANKGIVGKTIIVTLSTVDEVISKGLTNSTGYYLIPVDLSGDLPADEIMFRTNFEEDELYFATYSEMRAYQIRKEPTNTEEFPWPALVVLPIAAAGAITWKEVRNHRRKPNIPKGNSKVVTVQFDVDIDR